MNSLDGFLDDVVPILILDALENICLEFLNELCLLICEDVLEGLRLLVREDMILRLDAYLLNNSASIHLHRQLHYVILHLLSQHPLLDLISVLE